MTLLAPAPPLDQPYYGIPFLEACKRLVQKTFVFTGRASPSEYWLGGLGYFLAIIAGELVFALLSWLLTWIGYQTNSYGFFVLVIGLLGLGFFVLLILLILAQLSLAVRRLHDAGYPGAYYLFSLIPLAGSILLLVFVLNAPDPAGVRFDLPPGATRGYLFVPKGTSSIGPTGAPAGSGYGAPAPQGYTPQGYTMPTAAVAPAQGFAPSTGVAAPAVPLPGSFIPPVPVPPVPSALTVQPVPAAPAALVPPVPMPSAPSVPPVPAPAVPPVSSAPAVPSVPSPPVAPQAQAAPIAAPGPIQSIPGVVSSVPPLPAAPVVPAPAFVAVADDDDLDSTRISARQNGPWWIVLADGRQVPLGSSARLGRDPGVDPTDPTALLIRVDDPAKSISKTHVSVAVVTDGILITDLHSTNGTIVRSAGTSVVLAPEHPYCVTGDADVQLGDYVIQVRRG